MNMRNQRMFGASAGASIVREMRARNRRLGALFFSAFLLALVAGPRDATAFAVTLDTTTLLGVSGRLEFLLLDGDGVADNAVTISAITSNGTFVQTDCTVGCTSGPASFVIDDSLGFGQFLYDLTLGTSVSFNLSYTMNFGGVAGVDVPDRFALSLLDPSTNFTLVRTDITFPDDALLTIDLIGRGIVQLATVTDPRILINNSGGLAVPEPGSLALTALGLLVLATRRRSGSIPSDAR